MRGACRIYVILASICAILCLLGLIFSRYGPDAIFFRNMAPSTSNKGIQFAGQGSASFDSKLSTERQVASHNNLLKLRQGFQITNPINSSISKTERLKESYRSIEPASNSSKFLQMKEQSIISCKQCGLAVYHYVNNGLILIPDAYTAVRRGLDIKKSIDLSKSEFEKLKKVQPYPKWPIEEGNLITINGVKSQYYVEDGVFREVIHEETKSRLKIPWFHIRNFNNSTILSSRKMGEPMST